MSEGGHETRWILGFDGGCGTCGHLARELVALSEGKLTARSLRSAEVQRWREQALGSDAPWAPTLFAVDGTGVRAWIGPKLVLRLGRLVGPHKLWQIAGIVGGLMDPVTGPASPDRRRVIRQGLAGTAAAVALLGGGAAGSRLTALATGPTRGGGGHRFEKLKTADFNNMQSRAENNRHFQIIRDYFAHEDGRDWRGAGRDAYRYYRSGQRERDGYWVTFKNPGETEWVHVAFTKTAKGDEKAEGLLWRGRNRNFTDRFFVQNGNLRRDNVGRVEGADAAAVAPSEFFGCDFDEAACEVLGAEVCGVATAVSILTGCLFDCWDVLKGCDSYTDGLQQPCVDRISDEPCP